MQCYCLGLAWLALLLPERGHLLLPKDNFFPGKFRHISESLFVVLQGLGQHLNKEERPFLNCLQFCSLLQFLANMDKVGDRDGLLEE